jgi:hypothetical protein
MAVVVSGLLGIISVGKFDLVLLLNFFEQVYQYVSTIPVGKVTTYGQVAKALRTRVVMKDGSMASGYAFGGSVRRTKEKCYNFYHGQKITRSCHVKWGFSLSLDTTIVLALSLRIDIFHRKSLLLWSFLLGFWSTIYNMADVNSKFYSLGFDLWGNIFFSS